jgi:hypothetical protein
MATIAAAVLASSVRRLILKRLDDVIGVLSVDSHVISGPIDFTCYSVRLKRFRF